MSKVKSEQKLEESEELELVADACTEANGVENPTLAADRAETAAAVDERDEEVAKLRAERDALFDRLARLQAEFENYRKRAEREKADFREYALTEAVKLLLPVIDNFDLALKTPGNGDDLRKGVELIRRQMEDALAKLGVRPVPALGEPFDPHVHEAIEMVDSSEAKDNHVLEEFQRGYKLRDRLLRPAMVRVAKNQN